MAVDPAIEREIGRLAVAQNGVVTLEQLVAAGYTPAAIKTRVMRGDLHRMQRRIYAVGNPALLPLAAESAALLSLKHKRSSATAQLRPSGRSQTANQQSLT
jgi:hypothetical protein